MQSEKVKLWVKAKNLGVANYRTLSLDELKAAIKAAGKPEPVTTGNGAGSKRKRKSAVKTAVKRKTAPKKSAAKPATKRVKSAPAAKSATSKATAGKAKRPTTGTKSAAKVAKKAVTKATKTARKVTKVASNGEPGRILIDNREIDWTADTKIGASGGNRGTIMKLIRRHKGNVEKVFEALSDNAQTMYPKTSDGRKRSKQAAQFLLRWHISRIKFDFVKETGQHEGVVRSNGKPKAKAAPKPRKAVSRPKTAKVGKKSTRKAAGAQKGSRKATAASSKSRPKATKTRTAARPSARGGNRPGASAAARKKSRR